MPSIEADHARDLFEGDDGDTAGPWIRVTDQFIRQGRWHNFHYLVLGNEDGEFWGLLYGVGLTEYQENQYPWEGDRSLDLIRVYPHATTTVEYRASEPRPSSNE